MPTESQPTDISTDVGNDWGLRAAPPPHLAIEAPRHLERRPDYPSVSRFFGWTPEVTHRVNGTVGPSGTLRQVSRLPVSLTAALDDAVAALHELDARCCEPGRSPRMAALQATLDEVRELLPRVTDAASGDAAISAVEQAGAMIGALQVGCCDAGRLPLYARMLEQLTDMQIGINRSLRR